MIFRSFEFEDQKWFPSIIRNGMTDYLRFIFSTFNLYQPILDILCKLLIETKNIEILDLCSGSGGTIEIFYENLKQSYNQNVKIILTDLYPNIIVYKYLQEKTKGGISYVDFPVDARAVPLEIKGFRTLFSGFHHFQPHKAKEVIKNAIDCNAGIGIFDGGNKNFWMVLLIIIIHPILIFLCTPFIKPFKMSRIFFTYLIPVIPFCTIWDGIISITRLYSLKEMLNMAHEVDVFDNYKWTSGKVKNKFGISISYLIGIPFKN